jgi:hypothetical protein
MYEVYNIFVNLQDRYLENMQIKASFISFDSIAAITCFVLRLKGKTNDFGKSADFHTFALFAEKQVNLGVSGVSKPQG